MVEPWSQMPLLKIKLIVDKNISQMIKDDLLTGTIFSFKEGGSIITGPSNDIYISCKRRINGKSTEFWITNSERRRVLAKMKEFEK